MSINPGKKSRHLPLRRPLAQDYGNSKSQRCQTFTCLSKGKFCWGFCVSDSMSKTLKARKLSKSYWFFFSFLFLFRFDNFNSPLKKKFKKKKRKKMKNNVKGLIEGLRNVKSSCSGSNLDVKKMCPSSNPWASDSKIGALLSSQQNCQRLMHRFQPSWLKVSKIYYQHFSRYCVCSVIPSLDYRARC